MSTQTLSNPYKFRAYRNASLTPTASAATKTPFDSEDYDTNGNFASGTYTAPVNGFYRFSGRLATTTTRFFISLYKNSVEVARGNDCTIVNSNIGSIVTTELQLTAGDTVELWYFTASTNTIEVGSALAYFTGSLISHT